MLIDEIRTDEDCERERKRAMEIANAAQWKANLQPFVPWCDACFKPHNVGECPHCGHDQKRKGVADRAGYRVRVDWLGSRQLCCRMLVEEQRLWLQYNYGEVLGL